MAFDPGLLNAGTSIVTTGMGIRAAKDQLASEQQWSAGQAAMNRQYQTAEREAAQDWNLQQWNRENEYNSAKSQYDRLILAGMNPATALQTLSGSDNTANQLATSPQSGSMASPPGSIAGSLADLIGNSANTFWQNELLRQQTIGKGIENSYAPKLNEAQLKQIEADVQEKVSKKELNETEAKQIKELLPHLVGKTKMEIEEIKQSVNKLIAETNLIKQSTKSEEQRTQLTEEQKESTHQDVIRQKWENVFRTKFGIDPHDDLGSQLVQLALNGDIDKVVTNLFDVVGTFFGSVDNNTQSVRDDFRKWLAHKKQSSKFWSHLIGDADIPGGAGSSF